MSPINWENHKSLKSRIYTCGYCGNPLASDKGYAGAWSPEGWKTYIYICHFCFGATYFDKDNIQYPGAVFGEKVTGIPEPSVAKMYNEARLATGSNCYTAAVLCCRKLLMHIAVEKEAKEGESFLHYVEFLADNNYIPPDAKGWVDHIRDKGNEANHEIVIMSKDDAEELISFMEMLLKVIYEFPARIRKKPQDES